MQTTIPARQRKNIMEGQPRTPASKPALTTAERFIAAFGNHPAGVSVITADAGGGPVALTATSVCSVSVDPPLLAFSASSKSSSTPTIRSAETIVVHLLTAGQLPIAQLGATSGIDRFADTSMWKRLSSGEPYFPGVTTWIRGRIVNTLEASGATLVLVEALEIGGQSAAANGDAGRPLVYHSRAWHALGEHSRIR
ncbi:flavin reductase family protein [Paenarthrobacter ureafaciens]|uniref:flavin reductase family protein n=1 Tax=Paenarthrobacter ureafaciens TaxID=37931 RepID=UPI002DBD1086|nr:flavin reductase family protein [Paenarthrobacter ureafaciens]MEC3853135.1 flavin reductase family protein [Paenarthrobacter ureafaciens]